MTRVKQAHFYKQNITPYTCMWVYIYSSFFFFWMNTPGPVNLFCKGLFGKYWRLVGAGRRNWASYVDITMRENEYPQNFYWQNSKLYLLTLKSEFHTIFTSRETWLFFWILFSHLNTWKSFLAHGLYQHRREAPLCLVGHSSGAPRIYIHWLKL